MMNTYRPILTIVVPCYNEQEVLPQSHERLMSLLDRMKSESLVGADSGVAYVDDGSRDDTWSIIERLCRESRCVHGVKLAANSGHQNALLAGLEAMREKSDALVTIDADLQDDIEAIVQMVRKHVEEGCDIVYGVRNDRRTDSWFKRTTANTFYRLMGWLGAKTVHNHADFRLMSRRAVEQLGRYGERNMFLRGVVPLIGFKTATVEYARSERTAGTTKYPFAKMVSFAVDGITSFSIRPVRLVTLLGMVFVLISFALTVYVLVRYFTGSTETGWSSLMLSLWFVGGCILVGLGVVGEYIGKIYIEVKQRPRYCVEEVVNGTAAPQREKVAKSDEVNTVQP